MSPTEESTVWTTGKLRTWMTDAFRKRGIEPPQRMAEDLLAHVLGSTRLKLLMELDRPATPLERETLRGLVGRALKDEPIEYLTGKATFFGMEFGVDSRVLIPRPETAAIVESVLQDVRANRGQAGVKGEGLFIADLCTGSGAIAIAILKNLPGARGVATDISGDALAVARANATKHNVADRLDFLEGDLFKPLANYPPTAQAGSVDYLVSNPPYIPDSEWHIGEDGVQRSVMDFEPHIALRGGADGLAVVRPLIEGAPRVMRAGGMLLVEIAAATAAAVRELAEAQADLTDIRIMKDEFGRERVLVARKRS